MANIYMRALIVGVMAGMRSLVTPSIVSDSLSSRSRSELDHPLLSVFASDAARASLKVVATTELICDKLPFMPDRTEPGPLAFRFLSGAVCGAALCRTEGESSALGAAVGGLTAVVSAFAFYNIRQTLVTDEVASDTLVAVAEDALVVALGRFATDR